MKLGQHVGPNERRRQAEQRAIAEGYAEVARRMTADAIARDCGWANVGKMRAALELVRRAFHV
jgi:hypothetical protein